MTNANRSAGGERVPADDWEEEDLLTIDLAVERLDEGIAELAAKAEEAGADRVSTEGRLALLRARRDDLMSRIPPRGTT